VEATVLYDHLGLDDQAIREATAALELDPTSLRAHAELINAYVFNGRYREVLARRDELSPAPARAGYLDLALLYDPGGREELRKVLEKQVPEDEGGIPTRAFLLAFDGRKAEAESALREAARRASPAPNYYHHVTFYLAVGFAMVGQPEEAMRWLRKTAEIGFPNAVAFRKEPGLASLHGRADYEALVADLEKRRARWAAEAP
jgi:tetratricopeptide (TPR) repeat protein